MTRKAPFSPSSSRKSASLPFSCNTCLRIVYPKQCRTRPVTKNPEYRDLFPGALEMMILQSLRLQPMHGYALAKHIKQVSDDLLQIEEGSLYPALQRMLKEGWLESKPVSPRKIARFEFIASHPRASNTWNRKFPASKKCSLLSCECSRLFPLRSSLCNGSKISFPAAGAITSLQSPCENTSMNKSKP